MNRNREADTAGALHFSRAAEADGDFAGFNDDRDLMAAVRKPEHAREALLILKDIDVLIRDLTASESLTGARGVGSEVFAKYDNLVIHDRLAAAESSARNMS